MRPAWWCALALVVALVAAACGSASNSTPPVAVETTIPVTGRTPTPASLVVPETPLASATTEQPPVVVHPPTQIPAYDTAWEMAYLASDAEIVAYLDHVRDVGFRGFWFLALPFGGTNLYGYDIPDVDDSLATKASDGSVALTVGYTARIAWILDEAEHRNLGVGLVAAWAKANSCKTNGITDQNARAYGRKIGQAFDHPALDYWVLGGDLPFEEKCVAGDPQQILRDVSHELEAGIRDSGATQPTAFHTGAGQSNYDQFFDRDFVDVGAVQTGHCQDGESLKAKLGPVVERTDKPVILAESRYYQLAPRWPGCLHSPQNPVSAADIAADAQVALEVGVAAILFGDAQRYQWCRDKSDGGVFDLVTPDYDCAGGVADTFNTAGEQAFLTALR